jgi:hypothetical protein
MIVEIHSERKPLGIPQGLAYLFNLKNLMMRPIPASNYPFLLKAVLVKDWVFAQSEKLKDVPFPTWKPTTTFLKGPF